MLKGANYDGEIEQEGKETVKNRIIDDFSLAGGGNRLYAYSSAPGLWDESDEL